MLHLIGRVKELFTEDIANHEKELSEFIVFSKQSTDCHIVIPSGQIRASGERGTNDRGKPTTFSTVPIKEEDVLNKLSRDVDETTSVVPPSWNPAPNNIWSTDIRAQNNISSTTLRGREARTTVANPRLLAPCQLGRKRPQQKQQGL